MNIWDGLFFKQVYALSKSGPIAASIETLSCADFNTHFADIARRSLPVVVKDYFSAVDIETIKTTLINQLSDKDFVMRTGDYSAPANYIDKRETVTVSIEQFIHHELFSNNKNYLGNNEIDVSTINHLSDYPKVHPACMFLSPALWLGPASTVTPMHKDSSDNFAHIIYGRKKWLLVPVTEAKKMRYRTISYRQDSEFAISQLDFREHKNFSKLDIAHFEAVTEAGDLLYLPMGWGHMVENITPCIMVNYWLDAAKAPPGILGRLSE